MDFFEKESVGGYVVALAKLLAGKIFHLLTNQLGP